MMIAPAKRSFVTHSTSRFNTEPMNPTQPKPTHPHEDWNTWEQDFKDCRLLKIYPDYGGAFMWQADVCIDLGDWAVGHEDLERRFEAWSEEVPDPLIDPDTGWPQSLVDRNAPRWQDWLRRGYELAKEVRAVVPSDYVIWYCPFGEIYEIDNASPCAPP
jgi:hypothetical protein